MNSREFKMLFSTIANASGFESAFGGWIKSSPECIIVLDLQKSNFGDCFMLNIKVFVQGLFGKEYVGDKSLVKNLPGDVFFRPPAKHDFGLNMDNPIDGDQRRRALIKLFEEFILPTTASAMTRSGIWNLKEKGIIHLLPAVEAGLTSLS